MKSIDYSELSMILVKVFNMNNGQISNLFRQFRPKETLSIIFIV